MMEAALRDQTRTAQEISEGKVLPKDVTYARYGRGPGRKVDLPYGVAAALLGSEGTADDSVVMTDPPTEAEVKRDFKQGVFDQIDVMVDGMAKVASYAAPEGYVCDVIQFTKTSTEVPNITGGDTPNEYAWGAAIFRRLTNPAFQLTGASRALGELGLTWTAKIAQDDTDTEVPGYTIFSELYSAYRFLGAQLTVRPLGNDAQNEGLVFGGRLARQVDSLSTYWATERDFQEAGQMSTTSVKDQFSIFTTPSDINDLSFRYPWDINSADGAVALAVELNTSQKLSVRKVWTVLALRKTNYMVGLDVRSGLSFYPHEFGGRMRTALTNSEQTYYREFRERLAKRFGLKGETFLSLDDHGFFRACSGSHARTRLLKQEGVTKVRLLTADAARLQSRSLEKEDVEFTAGPAQYADTHVQDLYDAAHDVELDMINTYCEKLGGTKGLGGFLGTLASMISPSTVKAAADIAQQLPMIKDVAAPVNKILKDKTGKGISQLAETGWKWAKDNDI